MVYMGPLLGFSHDSGYLCKFKKTLHGLKQAPHAWIEKFPIVISSLEFVSSSDDYALFVKHIDSGRIILFLYVDNMIITSDDVDDISTLKVKLAKQFEMKALDPQRHFLGIEVAILAKVYLLSQSEYITIFLSKLDLLIIRLLTLQLNLMQSILLLVACLYQILDCIVLLLGA